MKAAIMNQAGAPLAVVDLDLQAPGPGEVRVRVDAAGICHSDYHYMVQDLACRTPIVLGHEGAGIVQEVGAGVTHVRPGDKVILTWRPSCGRCEYCSSGSPALCRLGAAHATHNELLRGGTRLSQDGKPVHHLMGVSCYAEECVVSGESVIKIPQEVPAAVAAIMGCAVITGMGVVLNGMGAPAGESILIVGAGGVGLSAVIGAAAVGAHPVIVADIDDEKLAKARELGATHTINTREHDLATTVHEITGNGAHWAVEAIGRPQSIREAVMALRPRGTAFVVGLSNAEAEINVPLNQVVQQEKSVRGSLYGSSNLSVQIPQILDMYLAGRLQLDALVGEKFSLAQINDAFDSLTNGNIGRSVVLMGSSN
ncbi:zinc-binding dehydrogenase [Arthrobacter sp. NPDC056727]|uniref:zinc-binding dehydrogenase n=1 Tax=Arthrobacter sp. NPDC056727 TaxID=3345927 RepID=UPI003672A49F